MRILRHILLFLTTALACSCINDELKDMVDTARNGEKVDVDISVNVPGDGAAYTKALGENPTINSLYLAVFDEAGYLVEYVKATERPVDLNGSANQKAYTVRLTLSNAKRIIHFIANNKETPKYGTEAESIGSLTTSDQWDVYWQRTVLENGIQLQADGETITEETKNALNNIGLIRNFAKLTMSNEASNFEPISFYVVNERTIGSVAPYNTSTGSFVDNYKGYASLLELQNIGYDGYIPKDAPLKTSIPQTAAEFDRVATPFGAAKDNYANYHYLYERETPLDFKTQPYIIVKGKYGGEGPYYYKISFSSYEGKLFPFLRNFNYGITIKTVNRKGSDTPLLASTSTGSGDISTSIDPTIINISDGSQRLFVSYTDTLLVSNGTINLRYKYIPDLGTGDTANDILADPATAQNSGVFFSVVTDQNATISANTLVGPVIKSYSVAATDGNDGYRTVSLQINNTQDIDLKEYILVSGQRMNAGTRDILSRKVTYTLRKKQPLRVVCDPSEIEGVKGTPVNVMIGIPAGLGESQFPMNISVEALGLTLSPDNDNLPVQTGKSTAISGETVGKPAFWFIRTVTWDEYNGAQAVDEYKYVDCHFKSNTASSATAIVASNKYFDQGIGSFTNYEANNFSNLGISGAFKAFAQMPINFKFDLPVLPQNSNGTLADSYVYIALDGADSDDPELEQIGTVTINGKKLAQYRYRPTSTGTQSLNLITTELNTGVVSAYLSAYHYNDANISQKAKIWFWFDNDLYTGATTNGMVSSTQSSITWYVHFEELTSTTVTTAVRNDFTSSLKVQGLDCKGYMTDIVRIDGVYYAKYVSSWNSTSLSDAVFQERNVGKYQAVFEARDNKGNFGSDNQTLIVREPIINVVLEDDWFNSSSQTVKAYAYCEALEYSAYPNNIRMEVTNASMGDLVKTESSKTIDGKTYYAYTGSWTPADYQNTYSVKGIIQYPNTGFSTDSNTQTITFDKKFKSISAEDATLFVGNTRDLNINDAPAYRTLTYTSSDPNVATVDNTGKITAKKFGTCTITIRATENAAYYGAEKTMTVTVSHRWKLVTSTQELEAGGIYMILNTGDSRALRNAELTSGSSSNGDTITSMNLDNTLSNYSNYTFTITQGYTVKSTKGDFYLRLARNGNNNADLRIDSGGINDRWYFSVNNSIVSMYMKADTKPNNRYLTYNNGFKFDKASSSLHIYKYVGE